MAPHAVAGDNRALLPEAPGSFPDPAHICAEPGEYIELASLFEHIYTDRLHFAIAGF